ncbi:MAG: hypothetical protein K2P22_08095 [Lachnospiraceae bacterium]|nr:hypothetical protein [Lachnospiraceae bacterium]
MKLTNYEKESIVLFNEADRTASVYTHNAALIRQLTGLCGSYPEQVRQTGDNGCGGLTFELPKKWLKVSPPRVLSAAQKEVLAEMNRKRWGKG